VHEDDAEQAVRAGLGLINAVGELPAPQRLQVRVGIAMGVVVVGDLIGTGSAQEQAIVGETPDLAARLQALAEPNAAVIAESTRRQIGNRFEVCDLGPQSLKGFAEPQQAWRVLAENRALGRFEALRSGAILAAASAATSVADVRVVCRCRRSRLAVLSPLQAPFRVQARKTVAQRPPSPARARVRVP
jgi:Adenylate and Guanylate cyclase catalytic domain